MNGYTIALFEQHAAMLAASGITPEHAEARGYVSVDTKKRLEALGITRTGRQVPGLLVPSLRVDGSTWGYQYRPDSPRDRNGRTVKYETPVGQRNGVDVPPGVGPRLADPSVPLWVTEGAKKADAAALAGLCAVDIPGVWSWLGTNPNGGKTALPEWRDIALNGRRVVLAFDGDVSRKKSVRRALAALAGYLTSKGAKVEYLHLPDDDDKVGLDDFLAEHNVEELMRLVHPEPPPLAEEPVVADDTSLSSSETTATAQPPLATTLKILDSFAEAVAAQGLIGEDNLAQLLYLTLTSRLLDRQVSTGVKGHSASGKSWTVDAVLRFFPRESYLTFTAMSQKALIYSTEEYAHRTIVMYEVVALREGIEDDMTSYLVRSLLSEGRIEYPVTVRDPKGGFTTKTVVKEGPTNLIFTTTKIRVHAENETRILSLNTDDSNEQTARVFVELAKDGTPSAGDLGEWVGLQRWLEGQDNRVAIPFARQLVERIPAVAVRLRRDVSSLLSLIRAHAVLHQATRVRDEQGRIVATLDDYATVRALVADILAEGVGATVSATVRGTVAAVAAITGGKSEASALQVAQRLKVDKSNAGRRLRAAADGGYVRNREDKPGKPGRWVLGDPLPETVAVLPTLEELHGCAVAPESEEERDTPATPPAHPCEHCGRENPNHARRAYCPTCWPT